jgi:GT2 family glycosyltransferase/glycosyltransferase involved in cell wall biosynthesis
MTDIESKTPPMVTVNILSYNSRDTLLFVLEQFTASAFADLEIIVVDNASTDGSCEAVRALYPAVKVIQLEKNIGIAGWNTGFKEASGKYVLVLDHDSFPKDDAIQKAVRCLENDSSIGLIAFKVINYYDNSISQSLEYERLVDKKDLSGTSVKRFVGGGAMIRRELIEKIGGYSETMFLYGFEADYAMKIITAGYTLKYFSDIAVFHKVGPYSKAKTKNVIYFTVRNHMWLFWKYSPWYLTLLKSLYIVALYSFKAFCSGNFGVFLRAMKDGMIGKPDEFRNKHIVKTQTMDSMLKYLSHYLGGKSGIGEIQPRVLFIYDIYRSFIHRDADIFERHFRVTKVKWAWSRNFRGLLFLFQMVREIHKAEVIVVWFTLLDSVFVTLFARLFGRKTIYFIGGHEVEEIREYGYGSMLKPWYRRLLPLSFRYGDRIVVPSQCCMEHLRRYAPGDNAVVVPHGFDPAEITVAPKKKQVVTVAPVVMDRLFLKGIIPFVRVANILPQYRFLIIGEIEETARSVVEKESVHGNVILMGEMPFQKVKEILAESRIYCQFSYHESFGCALAEAMLAGCIPVAVNRGAMPDVLGDVGFLVEFDNAAAAAGIIANQMENPTNPAIFRDHVIHNFHIARREKALLDVTCAIAGTKGALSTGNVKGDVEGSSCLR